MVHHLRKLLREQSFDWQKSSPWNQNIRNWKDAALFSMLDAVGCPLDQTLFATYAGQCDDPETLTAMLVEEGTDSETTLKLYSVLFELWRRYYPRRQTLSLLCDDLDEVILHTCAADRREAVLHDLWHLFDTSNEQGDSIAEVFDLVKEGCACELEPFLYDYLVERIEGKEYDAAIECLRRMGDLVTTNPWFEALVIRIRFLRDGKSLWQSVLKKWPQENQLLLEVLHFQVMDGAIKDFVPTAIFVLPLLEDEEEKEEWSLLVQAMKKKFPPSFFPPNL